MTGDFERNNNKHLQVEEALLLQVSVLLTVALWDRRDDRAQPAIKWLISVSKRGVFI